MPSLSSRIEVLKKLGRSRCAAGLGAALGFASVSEAQAIAMELIGLAMEPPGKGWRSAVAGHAGREAILAGVMSHWGVLGKDVQGLVVSAAGRELGALVGKLAMSKAEATRRAVAAMCADVMRSGNDGGASDALGDVLSRLCADASPEVLIAGLDALSLVLEWLAQRNQAAPEVLEAALTGALADFCEHRHAGVINAAVEMAHRAGPALRAFLAREDEPALMAMRGAARRAAARVGIARAVLWLAVPALAPVAVEWLETGGVEAQTELLSKAHMLELRGRGRAVRKMKFGERLLPSDARLADDPPLLRRASIRLSRMIGKPDRRLLHLSGFLADPDPMTRFVAVQALAEQPANRLVDDSLIDFTLDASDLVSAGAAGALASAQSSQRRRSLAPAFRTLLKSPHGVTRRLAEEVLHLFDPWHAHEGDRRWDCAAAARRAMASEPRAFIEETREVIRNGSLRQKLAAMGIVQRLGLHEQFETESLDAVRGRDQRIAAKAVRLLGDRPTPAAKQALREALEHPDPRVRADTIEVLGKIEPVGVRAEFEKWTRDEVARVRGNVLRHLMKAGSSRAESELNAMLHDARAGHRLAALWVVERTGASGFVRRVVELSGCDPDTAVRMRANRCARRLLARHGAVAPANLEERAMVSLASTGAPEEVAA